MSGNSKGNGETYGYNTQTESRNTRNFAGKNPSYGRTLLLPLILGLLAFLFLLLLTLLFLGLSLLLGDLLLSSVVVGPRLRRRDKDNGDKDGQDADPEGTSGLHGVNSQVDGLDRLAVWCSVSGPLLVDAAGETACASHSDFILASACLGPSGRLMGSARRAGGHPGDMRVLFEVISQIWACSRSTVGLTGREENARGIRE